MYMIKACSTRIKMMHQVLLLLSVEKLALKKKKNKDLSWLQNLVCNDNKNNESVLDLYKVYLVL